MIKDNIILHNSTRQRLDAFVANPVHAVLLIGPGGIGKTTLANHLSARLLVKDIQSLSKYQYIRIIKPEKGTISIDEIRNLQKFMQLTTTGDNPIRRIAVINNGGCLTTEAQNALLKMLEEPPSDTVVIITATSQQSLLPTVLSRIQKINVHPPKSEALKQYFLDRGYDQKTVDQTYFLSGGLPGLMLALLEDNLTHPLVEGVSLAKKFLTEPLPDRLIAVDALSKSKESQSNMLEAIIHMANTAIEQMYDKNNPKGISKWHRVLKESCEAQTALSMNANAKLVLSKLALSI